LLPGAPSFGYLFPDLQLLPNGMLLARLGYGQTWRLLGPGAKQWCAIDHTTLPGSADGFQPANGRLWWRSDGSITATTRPVQSLPLGLLRCGSTSAKASEGSSTRG
jgi:hypothetical protein